MKNISTIHEIPSLTDTVESKTSYNQPINETVEAITMAQDIPVTEKDNEATSTDSNDNRKLPAELEKPQEEENTCEFWNSVAIESERNFIPSTVEAIKSHFNITANAKDECLYIYDPLKGNYGKTTKILFPVWLYDSVCGTDCERLLTTRNTREIFSQLLFKAKQLTLESFDNDENYLNVLNGVVNLSSGELLPHDPQYNFLGVIKANYLPEGCEEPIHFIKMIERAFDTEADRRLFLETFAYLISGIYSAKKAIVYVGESNTGKSVILRLLISLIGEEFVSNVPLEKLSDRFAIHTIYGKKLNICGEHEKGQIIMKTSVFKGLVGRDRLDAEPKGRDHYAFIPKTKCLFACNDLPEFNPRLLEDALLNRFIFVEFKNPIPEDKRIKNFDEILLQERDSILTLLIKTLTQWKKDGCKFTETDSSRALMAKFKGHKGIVGEFVEDCCVLSAGSITPNYKLYEKYEAYCKENCLERLTPMMLIKELLETYPELGKEKKRLGKSDVRWCVSGIKLKDEISVKKSA